MIPDNARTFRITAAAGTELAGPCSCGTCKGATRAPLYSRTKAVYNPKGRRPARYLAGPIFLTAASRRSLDRVSVPMWGTFLSEPLPIVGLVGRYPANCLMGRTAIPRR